MLIARRKERADLHRCAVSPNERLAARILEDEDAPAPVAVEPERTNGPSRIELRRQRVLVLEPRQGRGRNVLARWSHDEHTGSDLARRAGRPGSVQDELTILTERLERAVHKIRHPATSHRPCVGARYQRS